MFEDNIISLMEENGTQTIACSQVKHRVTWFHKLIGEPEYDLWTSPVGLSGLLIVLDCRPSIFDDYIICRHEAYFPIQSCM